MQRPASHHGKRYGVSKPSLDSHGKLALMNSRFRLLLYLICGLTDFAAFVVIFAVSRGLAEGKAESWYLGVVGAGLSFSAGGSQLSGRTSPDDPAG